jgi:hypothetical protein
VKSSSGPIRTFAWLRVCALGLGVALGLSTPLPARADARWWSEAELRVKVHEHAFHRVSANNHQCVVRVRLYFDAPQAGYREPDPPRNQYRFVAEVSLSGGHRFVSEPFVNREAGPRVFAFSHDSQFDGCWADEERKLRKVDVHACRGQSCRPHAFEE